MMRVFLDTEFTDLHDPRLISLGLYTEAGQEFYAEVERAVWYDWRSEFVHAEVVPLLSTDGTAGESRAAIGALLRAWFARFVDVEFLVVMDFHTDWDLLEALLRETGPWPANVIEWPEHLDPWALDQAKGWGCVLARNAFYEQNCLVEHHALNDARALWATWRHAEKKRRRNGR